MEFNSIDSAVSLVRRSQNDTIFINNHPALFNYSKSKEINKSSAGGGGGGGDRFVRHSCGYEDKKDFCEEMK